MGFLEVIVCTNLDNIASIVCDLHHMEDMYLKAELEIP